MRALPTDRAFDDHPAKEDTIYDVMYKRAEVDDCVFSCPGLDAAGRVLPLFGTDDPTGVSSCPSW